MVTENTRIVDDIGAYTTNLGYIEPPFPDDCARFHLFGGTEADCIYNYANPLDPMTKIGTPAINANHVVCTPASGFQTSSGPFYGGTQIVVASQGYTIATRASAPNQQWMTRGSAVWTRQIGAEIWYRADGGSTGTDLKSQFVIGVQMGWAGYVERPFMLGLTATDSKVAMYAEEGTEFREYSLEPPSGLSTRSDDTLKIGGWGSGETTGFEAYLFIEYPERVLTSAEMNTVLHEFVQPLLEYRGIRKGAGLYA